MKKLARIATFFALLLLACAARPAYAQVEYLSPEEQDAIRDAQEIDKRADVFLKIADRRLVAAGAEPTTKVSDKDVERYGAPPSGSQALMLAQYRRALEEFMVKIDDSYERKGKGPLFSKAVKRIGDAMTAQRASLAALRAKLTDEDAIHECDRAMDSASVLAEGISNVAASEPPPAKKN